MDWVAFVVGFLFYLVLLFVVAAIGYAMLNDVFDYNYGTYFEATVFGSLIVRLGAFGDNS